jgi:hypothetical protein
MRNLRLLIQQLAIRDVTGCAVCRATLSATAGGMPIGTRHDSCSAKNRIEMEPTEAQRIKDDLKSQAYEGSRKILMSISNMIASSSVWQRDAFYEETMRHLAMLEQQLGQWRLKIARMQSDSIQPSREDPAP